MHSTSAELVGRADELTRLDRVLADAAAGRGCVVLVSGQAGIGKTTLTAALVERARGLGMPVRTGRAVPDEGVPALWPWWQALQDDDALTGLLDRRRDPDAAPAEVSRAEQLRDFERLQRLLVRQADGTGLVLVLEDLHWADELSLRLLRCSVGRAGVVVVATYRDDERHPALRAAVTDLRGDPATVAVSLRPWSLARTTEYVGTGAHPSWIPMLHDHSGGNPLYARELLGALVDAGLAGSRATPDWPLGVPGHLLDVVGGRLARLPADVVTVVSAAAVFGVVVRAEHAATLCGRTVPDVLAAAADSGGLLVPDDGGTTVAFGHILVRDAVYAAIPPDRRLAWHRAVADAIEAGTMDGEPVTHRLRSATDPASRAAAVLACRAAAAKARTRLAFRRAAELLDAALSVFDGTPAQRAELLLDAADLDYGAGLVESAVDRCLRAAECADEADPARRAELLARAAVVVRGVVGPTCAPIVALCDRALAALPETERSLRARVLAQRALAIAEAVHPDEADAPSREAIELAEQVGDPIALSDALRARQQVLSGHQGVTQRLDLARRMLDLGDTAPPGTELWGRLWRIDAAMQLGTFAVMDDELARLGVLADRLGWPLAHWHLHRMRAARQLVLARFAAAEREADQALAWAKETQDATAVVLDVPFRAELCQLTGRFDVVADRVWALAEPALAMPVALAGVGRFFLEAGDLDRAERCLDQLRPMLARLPDDGRWLPTVGTTGRLGAALGDDEVTRWCYERLTGCAGYYLAAGSGSVICEGSVSRPLGTMAAALGDTEAAARHFQQGIAMDDRVGAIAYRTLGEIGLAELRDDRALAAKAAITARRLGMPPALRRAEAVTARRHDDGLTRREREVLGRLVAGSTNREIAESLVLSERTVETHVSNLLGKLGVSSRGQAVSWAHDHGYGH